MESPRSYTSFDQKDPLAQYAKDHGFEKVDYNNNCNGCNDEYWFNLDEPELDRHLRVVRYDGPKSPALASAAMAAGGALGATATSGAAGLDPDFGDGGIASYDLSDPKERSSTPPRKPMEASSRSLRPISRWPRRARWCATKQMGT